MVRAGDAHARQGASRGVQQSAMLPLFTTPAAVSLAGLARDRSARDWIAWAADKGFRGVAIDGTAPGVRARELGRGARRDLASLLRRRELPFVGIDLWIPPAHFSSHEHQDRAVGAVERAIDLARDLATLTGDREPVLSVSFPASENSAIRSDLVERALNAGVVCADHAWPIDAEVESTRVGIDPATLLLAGADPGAELPRYAGRLGCVRLSDADQSGRAPVGSGRLDVDAYRAAALGVNWQAPVVIDVRGLNDGDGAAKPALALWTGSG